MAILRRLAAASLVIAAALALEACSSTGAGNSVQSSGTPVNPFADPGGADQPSAPLTGAQAQHR